MSWTGKTYWVMGSNGLPEYAISSEMGIADLRTLLSLDSSNEVITPATEVEPCKQCPHMVACMSSVWAEGKRMAGPSVGEGTLSDVLTCLYCNAPTLVLYKRGPENPVPEKCPRRTVKSGACDGCRRVRASLTECLDPPEEDVDLVREILGAILTDTDLQSALAAIDEAQKNECLRRWVMILCGGLHKDDAIRLVRTFVLEMSHGPLEKAWSEKTPASRRFLIRCWEGLVRRALD